MVETGARTAGSLHPARVVGEEESGRSENLQGPVAGLGREVPSRVFGHGLKKLIELKGWAEGSEYRQVLVRLGDLIEEALDMQPALPPHPQPIAFGAIGNAFQEPKL